VLPSVYLRVRIRPPRRSVPIRAVRLRSSVLLRAGYKDIRLLFRYVKAVGARYKEYKKKKNYYNRTDSDGRDHYQSGTIIQNVHGLTRY
jgi:hypothetical protein